MNSIVEQVEQWYSKNSGQWSKSFSTRLSLKSEPERGAVTIHVDTQLLIGIIALWNKGDTEAFALHRVLYREMFLDYRVLGPSDNVNSLLDGYLQRVVEDGTLPGNASRVQIKVFGMISDDWRVLLHFLDSSCQITYAEDGVSGKLPSYDMIATRQTAARLSVNFAGLKVNSSLLYDADLTLELLPEEVETKIQGQMVLDFMVAIARLLKKEVLMTPGRAAATIEWFRENALCEVDPQTGVIDYHISAAWGIGETDLEP